MTQRRDLLPYAAAALLVIPYLSLGLPFRRALIGQAVAVLTVTLALGLSGVLAGGAKLRLRRTPKALWIGAALWILVAISGAAVGFAAGNGRGRIAGQLLALSLLPLGLLVGRLSPPHQDRFRALTKALVAVVAAACLLHFGVWCVAALRGLAPRRLYLDNSVSVAGAIPLVLVLLLALRPRPHRRGLFLGVFVVYLAGAGSRGAWLAAVLGALLLLLLGGRRAKQGGSLKRSVGVLVGVLLCWLSLIFWLEGPRRNQLTSSLPGVLLQQGSPSLDIAATTAGSVTFDDPLRQRILVRRFEARAKTSYRLVASFRGGERGRAYIAVRWLDAQGRVLGRFSIEGRPSESFLRAEAIDAAPAGTVLGVVLVGCRTGAVGSWEIGTVEVHRLGPGFLASPLRQLAYLDRRLASFWRLPLDSQLSSPGPERAGPERAGSGRAGLADETRTEDVSLAPWNLEDWGSVEFRLAESTELWRRFQGGSRFQKLWGHGLGATFELRGLEFHYIHNLYAYLLFKLGLIGGGALLAAIFIWLFYLLGRRRHADGMGWEAGALLAIWCAYLAWGLTSPEILDFRLAPLFGMLLVALSPDGRDSPQTEGAHGLRKKS